jgi:putative molybdopterin biosynthesis protein
MLGHMGTQQQFLDVIDRDEAERRFRAAIRWQPLGGETVALAQALGRVLRCDVTAPLDVPSFDRSNYDGYAVRAADTSRATETEPVSLQLLPEMIATAVVPQCEVVPGSAATIATGGMLPRGADAVVMVEHTDEQDGRLLVRRAVAPAHGISFAGSDIAAGEIVLRAGHVLTSRETGVLAAIGLGQVDVHRRVRVAIVSTGDEVIPPGDPMQPGKVYDSNSRIIADAVRELGAEPIELGIVPDELDRLQQRVSEALGTCDVVLLSGGTSKGQGDISYHVLSKYADPGIVAHGVALKPGKPICLAASGGKPMVILPGFPTSAIFTFHEFVAPVIRRLGGRPAESRAIVRARLAVQINSVIGRTEFALVGLVAEDEAAGTRDSADAALSAFPIGKGSGSVTAFSHADGFVTIDRYEEIVPAGTVLDVQLLARDVRTADLVVIGSHCVGLDYLLSRLQAAGFQTKFLAVGSSAGLEAVRRGQCDLAGIHLFDPASGQYNRPFLTGDLQLVPGYGRMQGVVFRRGDPRFEGREASEAVADAGRDPTCIMVNRNQGSGTRILIERLLQGAEPPGYAFQPRSHNAVAAAVVQRRADWGVAIHGVADQAGLGFLPVTREHYDFVVPAARWDRPAVRALRQLLADEEVRSTLAAKGLLID